MILILHVITTKMAYERLRKRNYKLMYSLEIINQFMTNRRWVYLFFISMNANTYLRVYK